MCVENLQLLLVSHERGRVRPNSRLLLAKGLRELLLTVGRLLELLLAKGLRELLLTVGRLLLLADVHSSCGLLLAVGRLLELLLAKGLRALLLTVGRLLHLLLAKERILLGSWLHVRPSCGLLIVLKADEG